MSRKRLAPSTTAPAAPPASFDQTPALESAIDRLFPADVLENLRDPDRPAPDRLDQAVDADLHSGFSC